MSVNLLLINYTIYHFEEYLNYADNKNNLISFNDCLIYNIDLIDNTLNNNFSNLYILENKNYKNFNDTDYINNENFIYEYIIILIDDYKIMNELSNKIKLNYPYFIIFNLLPSYSYLILSINTLLKHKNYLPIKYYKYLNN